LLHLVFYFEEEKYKSEHFHTEFSEPNAFMPKFEKWLSQARIKSAPELEIKL